MNIKALIKSLAQRKFLSTLLLLQLALTLGLVVNSIILALDTHEKLSREVGFDVDTVYVVSTATTSPIFNNKAFFRSVLLEDLEKLKAIPGVVNAAIQLQVPIKNDDWSGDFVDLEQAERGENVLQGVSFYFGSVNTIETFGLTIIEGRSLTWADDFSLKGDDVEHPIVVSQALANHLYPNQSAIGRLTNRGRIVGVSSNFLDKPRKKDERQFFYFRATPMLMSRAPQHYVIRVAKGQMASVRKIVAKTLLNVNPERVVLDQFTMRERHSKYFKEDTGLRNLFFMLSLLMLVITGISSYAHAQFHVTKQRKFMGIRRALGAKRKDILLYVLSENWLLTTSGAVLGMAFIVGFNLLLNEHIMISKPQVSLYFLAVGVIFTAGTIATWIPARKTSRIPPVIATRTL